jgi:Gnt-I system low-affinity gluconate transporter
MESELNYQLVLAFVTGVAALLVLILRFKVNAFISLLIASIVVGIASGMKAELLVASVVKGMGDTLGFVATIVGLGAIFGEMLQRSGSTEKLSKAMLDKVGVHHSPKALALTGFIIAIPVFFDVAFIILMPVLYSLQRKTGKSLLHFALPLLAGLAVAHAFIPPTPGPIAVADILKADLGWVILWGLVIGFPTTIVAGLVYGTYIAKKIYVPVPPQVTAAVEERHGHGEPALTMIVGLIALPIVLILLNTASKVFFPGLPAGVLNWLQFLGHPIIALLLPTLLALYFLGIKMKCTKDQLQELTLKALGPAGIIILITGAGGVFKQMLMDTGAGAMLARQFSTMNAAPLIVSFVLALIIRLVQGSATVAMVTAAGIMAPILLQLQSRPALSALMVISIAAGASGFSHVNDSGFWLVNRYMGISEADTLRSWTVMTGVLSLTALVLVLLVSLFV